MGEEVAGEARDVNLIVREMLVEAAVADLVGNAPAAAELHRPHIEVDEPRIGDCAVGLLHQQTFDAEPSQFERQREPDRTTTDD